MNASSFVILNCRKSNHNWCLSRYWYDLEPGPNERVAELISYFANQIWNEKYQQGIRIYDWSSDSNYFVFISASIHDLRLRLT